MIGQLNHALGHHDPNKPVRLLLRHGARLPIPKGVFGDQVYLTPQGHQESQALGQQIDHPLVDVFHSPVHRCAQTAINIIQGAAQSVDIKEASGLFLAYFKSQQEAEFLLANHPVHDVASALIEGQSIEGMKSLEEGSKDFLGQIFCSNQSGLQLFVSHDLLICLLNHYLLGLSKYNPKLWPGFLQGMVFWEAKETSYFSYAGETGTFLKP